MAIGAGMLVLVGLISSSIWLWQRDDGHGQALEANDQVPGQLELSGLPSQFTTGAGANGDAGPASANDSVEQKAPPGLAALGQGGAVQSVYTGGTVPGITAAVDATVSDSARLDASGVGPGVTAGDDTTVSDSAELVVQQAQTPPPRGGPGEVASVGDSAGLVIRDSKGNIKHQETVK